MREDLGIFIANLDERNVKLAWSSQCLHYVWLVFYEQPFRLLKQYRSKKRKICKVESSLLFKN